jgi:lipopolysaccharide biosynthesis glycosyltransferase
VFVMRADRFRAYAEWLFDILFACEAEIDLATRARTREPVLACLAEQLFPGYLDYVAAAHGARITGFGVAYGQLDRPVLKAEPILATIEARQVEARETLAADRIHVTFAIDDNYTPHCAAALASLFAHLHPRQQLTVHILHDDSLSRESQDLLAALSPQPHIALDFVPVAAEAFELYPHNRPHISRATYYRLALHRLLPDLDKTIYLDADIILADNVAKIWIDLGDHLAAAVVDEGGVTQSRRLALPLSHAYFNAGVCLFNLKALRTTDADALYWRSFESRRDDIILQDQDILNIAFCGRTLRLPLRWNANGRLFRTNELECAYSEAEAHEAAQSPALIHYTDVHKPWLPGCPHPLTPLYWRWREAALATQAKQKATA